MREGVNAAQVLGELIRGRVTILGRFARADEPSARAPGGRGALSASGGGSSRRIALNISIGLLRWKGFSPVTISKSPTPSAKTSERSVAFSPRSCSGET